MLCVIRAPFTTIAEQVSLSGKVCTCIYEVPGANLGRDTGYAFRNLSQSSQEKTVTVPYYILQPSPPPPPHSTHIMINPRPAPSFRIDYVLLYSFSTCVVSVRHINCDNCIAVSRLVAQREFGV